MKLPPSVHSLASCLHPAHALRGLPQLMPSIHAVLRRARRWADSESGPVRDLDLDLEATPHSVASILKETPHSTPVAIDVETPEDNPTKIDLCGIATGPRRVLVFEWTPEHAKALHPLLASDRVVKVGHNFSYDRHAFAASGLEVAWPVVDTIQAAALIWPPFREAKNRRWLSLATCVLRVLEDVAFWKRPADPKTREFYRAAWPHVPDFLHPRLYCALDCVYTLRLWQALRQLLEHEDMLHLFTEIVAPAGYALWSVEARGFPVDIPARDELRLKTLARISGLEKMIRAETQKAHDARLADLRAQIVLIEAHIDALWKEAPIRCFNHLGYRGKIRRAKCPGCVDVYEAAAQVRAKVKERRGVLSKCRAELARLGDAFQPSNDNHWRWLLFDHLGLESVETTDKKKEPKVDERTIEVLTKRHPDIPLLAWRAELQELLHRVRGVLSMPVDENGRTYFVYSLHRTENGRVASGLDAEEEGKRRASSGNAQNVKHEDRRIFWSGGTDHLLVQFDWKQVEVLVMAWFAGEDPLLEAFAAGADLHALNAAAIYGCAPEEAPRFKVRFEGREVSARYAAKRATHGWDYGLGARKTARMYGMGETEARRAIDAYFARWPGLRRFQEETIRRAEDARELVNPFGRRLRFFGFEKRGGRWVLKDREEALAFLPASTVGDMCKAVLPEMEALKAGNAELLTTTHDSFTVACDVHHAPAVVLLGKRIMERLWPELGERNGRHFAARCDVEVGLNWGKASKANPEGLKPYAA